MWLRIWTNNNVWKDHPVPEAFEILKYYIRHNYMEQTSNFPLSKRCIQTAMAEVSLYGDKSVASRRCIRTVPKLKHQNEVINLWQASRMERIMFHNTKLLNYEIRNQKLNEDKSYIMRMSQADLVTYCNIIANSTAYSEILEEE